MHRLQDFESVTIIGNDKMVIEPIHNQPYQSFIFNFLGVNYNCNIFTSCFDG